MVDYLPTPANEGPNHHVAHRKALAWMGHSSSNILDLYYHLSDAESEATMKALAESF